MSCSTRCSDNYAPDDTQLVHCCWPAILSRLRALAVTDTPAVDEQADGMSPALTQERERARLLRRRIHVLSS